MANTYTLIASSTVGSGGATDIEFTAIPNTYTDLLLSVNVRIDNANGGHFIRFNGSSSNYSSKKVYSDSGTVISDTGSSSSFFMWTTGTWATANTFGNSYMYIPNYTSSNYKSVSIDSVNENNSSSPWAMGLIAGLWSDSSVISSIKLIPEGAGTPKFVQYSTAYLYGIKNS
jgi:hypothetical protein